MIKRRVLLAMGILGVLAGCGAVVSAAVPSAPQRNAPVTVVASTPPGTPTPPSVESTAAPTTPRAAAVVVPPAAAPAVAGAVAAVSVSAPAPARSTPPIATSPPLPQRNLLTGPHGLNAVVGADYTDCSGMSEVAHDTAVIDTCHTTAVLFIGHNRGVFTPLLSYVVGDVIAWSDRSGTVHHLRIVAVRDVSSNAFPAVLGTYEFQTCLYPTANSSLDRDLDAVEV